MFQRNSSFDRHKCLSVIALWLLGGFMNYSIRFIERKTKDIMILQKNLDKFLTHQDAVQAQYVIEKCSELSESANGKENY